LGAGWLGSSGELFSIRTSRESGVGCRLTSGGSRCQGGSGNLSLTATAQHPVRLDAEDFVLRLLVYYGFQRPDDRRAVGIGVQGELLAHSTSNAFLGLDVFGRLQITGGGQRLVQSEPVRLAQPVYLELRGRGSALEARCWSATGPPPEAPDLRLELPAPWPRIALVRVSAANLVGGWIEVEELTATSGG
jgi:hypothetical protein